MKALYPKLIPTPNPQPPGGGNGTGNQQKKKTEYVDESKANEDLIKRIVAVAGKRDLLRP